MASSGTATYRASSARRWAWLLAVLGLFGALWLGAGGAPAAAQAPVPTESGPQPPVEEEHGPCDVSFGPADWICDRTVGQIGDVIVGGAESALRAVVSFVVDGAAWLLEQLAEIIDDSTRPNVTSGWFQGAYRDMTAVAVLGLLPFLLLAIVQAVIRQDGGSLLRSVAYVPVAALGTGAAVVVVDMLVTITDALSAWISQSLGADLTAFATGLGTAVLALSAPTGGTVALFAGLIAAGMVAFTTFVIWIELLLRQAAIYVAVLFLPLGFMALVWPATAHWLRRLVQGLVAIILSKFVIMAVMALAATAMDAEVATEGFAVVVSGAALLLLAALAPYVLLRLIPVFEAGLSSQLEGTLRRPTAAVSPHSGGQIARMVRARMHANGAHGAGTNGAAGGGIGGMGGNGAGPGGSEAATGGPSGGAAKVGARPAATDGNGAQAGGTGLSGAGGAAGMGTGVGAAAAGVGAAVGAVAAGVKGAKGAGEAASARGGRLVETAAGGNGSGPQEGSQSAGATAKSPVATGARPSPASPQPQPLAGTDRVEAPPPAPPLRRPPAAPGGSDGRGDAPTDGSEA